MITKETGMAKNRMKQKANKHRTKREVAVGDYVYLKLEPYINTQA